VSIVVSVLILVSSWKWLSTLFRAGVYVPKTRQHKPRIENELSIIYCPIWPFVWKY
jgi:hypothetical protein